MEHEEHNTEEEENSEEEDLPHGRGPLPLDELDLALVDPDIGTEIAELDGFQSYFDQVESITKLMRHRNTSFRIIDSVFHLTKRALNHVYKRALHHHQSRGRPLKVTVAQMGFLQMVIEDRFNQKMPVTYSELLRELE
jgi:hypothetical protein